MTTNWVPGHLGTIKLGAAGADDITAFSNVVGLALSKNDLTKPTLGNAGMRRSGGGLRDAVLDCAGHAEGDAPDNTVEQLVGYFEGTALVVFEWQMGTPTSDFDIGIYAGSGVITALNITTDAEDEYEWTFSLAVDGVPTFTPGTPAP